MIVYLEIPISGVAKWLEGVVDMWNGMGTSEVVLIMLISPRSPPSPNKRATLPLSLPDSLSCHIHTVYSGIPIFEASFFRTSR